MAIRTQRPRKRLTPLIALLGVAALMAATTMWLYTSSSPARADAGPQLHDVDGFYAIPKSDGTWDYVRLDYMMAAGTSDADAAAQAQADAAARFPGAVPLNDSGVSAAYVLTGFKWTAGTTSWSYDATGAPAGLTGASAALSAAAATWGAAGANFHFTGGGPSSNGTGACGNGLDGSNTVGWAVQSGAILAVTCSHWQGGGSAVEFDMQIDPGWTWTTGASPNVDLQSVVTHEMGHALGLNHSADPSAVMYASYTQGTLKRSLTADDIAGEVAIYGTSGGGASPTPSPSPSNTPTSTPTPTKTPTRTPTPTNTPTQPAGSPSPSNTPTNTPTQAATNTPTPTPTTQASPSVSATASPTPTKTTSATASPTPTQSPTPPSVPTGTTPTLPLSPGANLLTWPGATSSPGSALAGELGAIRIIYQWDPVTQTWLRYGPSLPSFVNNLTSLTQGKAYWFIATSAAQVPFVP